MCLVELECDAYFVVDHVRLRIEDAQLLDEVTWPGVDDGYQPAVHDKTGYSILETRVEYLDVNVDRHRRRIETVCSDRTAEVTSLEIAPESNLMTTPIRGTVTPLALSPHSVALGVQEDVQRAVADLVVRRSPSDVGEAAAQKRTAGTVAV